MTNRFTTIKTEPIESSMTTQTIMSTSQSKSPQLKDLEFELAWNIRDDIIFNLNQQTKVLSGLVIQIDARKKMRKANCDLMVALMSLPLKVDGVLRSLESGCSSVNGTNEVVLDLNWEIRCRIVNTLLTNHSIALSEGDSLESENKSKLIEKNNELVCELLKLKSRTLPVRQLNLPTNISARQQANNTDQAKSSNQMAACQSNGLQERLALLEHSQKCQQKTCTFQCSTMETPNHIAKCRKGIVKRFH